MEKQQMDKTKYLESKKHDFSDQKIIELIEDDLEYGLTNCLTHLKEQGLQEASGIAAEYRYT